MHASKFGGHSGINRTLRRLSRWLWWPKMKESCVKYIEGCLICQRHKPVLTPITIRGVLEKPGPFELISVDHVGPRIYNGKECFFVVIIDHASRFIVAKATDINPTAEWTIKQIKNSWVSIFYAPQMILVDRGSIFTSHIFEEYVHRELGATIIRTSPYYPQGNGINEASHRAINNMMEAASITTELNFEELLQLAVDVHNSSPHLAHGRSPYFYLFGMEPQLPGWQRFQSQRKEIDIRHNYIHEIKARSMHNCRIREENKLTAVKERFQTGSWIIYPLSFYEQRQIPEKPFKYSLNWSLPAKIVQIRKDVAIVSNWLDRERQVPLSSIRILKGEVSPSLMKANLEMIKMEMPVKHSPIQKIKSPPQEWKEFCEKSKLEINEKDKTGLEMEKVTKKRKLKKQMVLSPRNPEI